MSKSDKTHKNHFVPEWYQSGFLDEGINKLHRLGWQERIINGKVQFIAGKKKFTPAQNFYVVDLYSTFFGGEMNDDVEKKLFGPIDNAGSSAVRAFLSNNPAEWHRGFLDLFKYLDAQKLRTPKGLDWIKSKYPKLSQEQLMQEMQKLRLIHCTLWAEGVRELVSAENSEVKFIISDHPVTIYNHACPPHSPMCVYPRDPDISLLGSQTIFPLDKNRCLILTNLEYAQNPDMVNPLGKRSNAIKIRKSLVSTINFINSRMLKSEEVTRINHIIKSRAKNSIAGSREADLYPESNLLESWEDLRQTLLPPSDQLFGFAGEMYAEFNDGRVYYQDALGRTKPNRGRLKKIINESGLKRNDSCGCGSGRKYKSCCMDKPFELRSTWTELSIRERNMIFCHQIRKILDYHDEKTWDQVRREITNQQISRIYEVFAELWPLETDIYSLLPKPDGRVRALYSGTLDYRTIGFNALPMASLVSEFLLENPIVNPNMVKPELNPVLNPSSYRYQALKDLTFILSLEPLIEAGIVTLYPDPVHFDPSLAQEILAINPNRRKSAPQRSDIETWDRLAIEDYLNSSNKFPKKARIDGLMEQFGLGKNLASQILDDYDTNVDESSLAVLQPPKDGDDGFIVYTKISPNYEMSLFLAQATGSIIITDSDTRWNEVNSHQFDLSESAKSSWEDACKSITKLPLDYSMLRNFQKSQNHYASFRELLALLHKLVYFEVENESIAIRIADEAASLHKLFDNPVSDDGTPLAYVDCNILAPTRGLVEVNVNRMLVRSGCQLYDSCARMVVYIRNPKDNHFG